ncbi:hypothetical protein McanCB56680_002073 [Microsporum canis]
MASQLAIDRDEDGEDDISVTSTAASEPREEYNITGVLAERIADNGELEYLVSWENYPIHRSSWEPAENFGDPETTLKEWNEKKEAIKKGTEPKFDLVAFEKLLVEVETATLRRKRKRRLKRMRLGLACGNESEDASVKHRKTADGVRNDCSSSSSDESTKDSSPASRKERARLLPKEKSTPARKSSVGATSNLDAGNGRTFKTALRKASQPAKQLKIPPSSAPKLPQTAPPPIKVPVKVGHRLPIRNPPTHIEPPQNGEQAVQSSTQNSPISMPPKKSAFPFARSTARRGGPTAVATGRRESQKPPSDGRFRTISTQRKHYKMSRAERAPDISQLDLRPPSEWLTATGRSTLPERLMARKRPRSPSLSPRVEDLFVVQDDDQNFTSNLSAAEPPKDSNNTGTPKPTLQGPVKSPELHTAQIPKIHPKSVSAQPQQQRVSAFSESPKKPPLPVLYRIDSHGISPRMGEYGDDSRTSELPQSNMRNVDTRNSRNAPLQDSTHEFQGNRITGISPLTGYKRSWDNGDVMVHLVFSVQAMSIGDVRIVGLPSATKHALLSLKKDKQVIINLGQVCSPDQYHQLRPTLFDYGHILPFEDTSSEVDNLAEYLFNKRSAAVWNSPISGYSRNIVVYPSEAREWRFLNANRSCPLSAHLRLVVTSLFKIPNSGKPHPLPPLLPPPPPPPPPTLPNAVPLVERSTKDTVEFLIGGVRPQIATSTATDTPNLLPLREPPRGIPLTSHESLPLQASSSSQEATPKPLPKRTRDLDVVAYFKNHYGISFEQLTLTQKHKNIKHVFYLLFPSEMAEERELVQNFLRLNRILPYSHETRGDWDRFVKEVTEPTEETQGVILSHQKFKAYDCMPKLQILLHHQAIMFSISLARPIKWVDDNPHILRLFPDGCVILMTEDFILHDCKNALKVVEWIYSNFWDNNVKHGPKLFFRPNIRDWLHELWPTWHDENLYHFSCFVNALIPDSTGGQYSTYREASPESLDGETDDEGQHHVIISTCHLPGYGSRSEQDHPNIPKGLTQEERNIDHLVEYFAGWAITNVENFRYFPVLTHRVLQPRWKNWSHVEVFNYTEFYSRYMKADIEAAAEPTQIRMANVDL